MLRRFGMVFVSGLALICGLPPPASAETFTRSQVEAMTDAQREASSILGVIGAIQPDQVAAIRFFVQRSLAEMGYGSFSTADAPDDQLRNAASAYQRRIGARPTGDLTGAQFERLRAAVQAFGRPSILLGTKHVAELQGYLLVEGTWTVQGEEHAFPFNRSRFECWRERRTCVESQSYLAEGIFGMVSLETYINHYDVVKWAGEEVQIEISHQCVTNTVFINARTKDVTMTRRPKSACGNAQDRLETKLFVLVDGSSRGRDLERKRFEETVVSVMSPDLWKRFIDLAR